MCLISRIQFKLKNFKKKKEKPSRFLWYGHTSEEEKMHLLKPEENLQALEKIKVSLKSYTQQGQSPSLHDTASETEE